MVVLPEPPPLPPKEVVSVMPALDSEENKEWVGEDALWNDNVVLDSVVSRERPWHRIAIYLAAQGKSNREIAAIVGRSEYYTGVILRHPFARSKILQLIREAGQDEIEMILKSAVKDSIFRIIDISTNAKDEQLRYAANVHIVDRVLGKPVAKVETESNVTVTRTTVEEIDRELEVLRAEENRLVGRN